MGFVAGVGARTQWLAIAVMLMAAALLPATVEAHAALVRSDPTSNASLAQGPTQIVLTFTEPVEPSLSAIRVLSSGGEDFAEGSAVVAADGFQLSTAVRELPPDVYSVVWTNSSTVDGHSLTGAFPLTVLNPDGSRPAGNAFAPTDSGSYSPPLSGVIARWILLFATAGVLGAGVFTLLGGRVSGRTWESAGAALAVAGAIAFVEYVVRERSAGFGTLLQTRQGMLVAGEAVAAVLAGVVAVFVASKGDEGEGSAGGAARASTGSGGGQTLREPEEPGSGAARHRGRTLRAGTVVVVASAIPVLIALGSHPATGIGHAWSTVTLAIHIWLGLAWPGALVMLALAYRAGDVTRELFLRFSTFALVSAAVVIIGGVLVAATQVPSIEGLTESDYGRALVLKVALAVAAIVFAGVNTLLLHQRLDAPGAFRGLAGEVVVLGLVLLVAGRLSQLPPPASQARGSGAVSTGFERTAMLDDLTATLAVAPNTVGNNRFIVALSKADGSEVGEVLRVRLRFTPSDPSLGRSEVIANPVGGNRYQAEGAFLSMAGQWTVGIDVRRRGMDDVAGEVPLSVAPPVVASPGSAWEWPVKQFSLLQYAAMLVGVAGVVLVLGQLRGGLSGDVFRSKYFYAGIGLALWGFGFPFFAREEQPIDYLTMQNPIEATDASVDRGREVYLQNCAACHGDGGRGDGPLAATLNPPPFDLTVHAPLHSDGQLFGWISEGIPRTAMPAWKDTISEEDRWNVVNFLRTLTQ